MEIRMTLDDFGNYAVAYSSGAVQEENLDGISVNDILSNAAGIERVRRHPGANILTTTIGSVRNANRE